MKKINFSKIKQIPGELKKINIRKFNWLTVLTLLSYLNVLVLIPFFGLRKSKFGEYHARQGLALLAVWVIGGFSFYLPVLPYLFVLFILVCMIYGIINVILGREHPLPLIGKLALKF